MISTTLSPETLAERLAALRGGAVLSEHKTVAETPISVPIAEPLRPEPELDATINATQAWLDAQPDYVPEVEAAPTKRKFRFARPLWTAAETWVEYLRNTDERWMLGLKEIDVLTRGFGRGELVYITGFAHSGKTQVFLTAMLHNLQKPTVLFTFDEPAELVLAKLVGMRLRRDGEVLEAAVKGGDKATIAMVHDLASREFKNLMVIDEPLGLSDMTIALEEATAQFSRPVEAVGIDYLELLRADETEIEKKSQALKRWTKGVMLPVICLHQGSRGNAGKGQELTMQSMKYGGEAEATFVIGVRRKRDDPEFVQNSSLHDTVSVSVLKNKRPPSRKGEHDFFMDPSCGAISSMHDVEFRKQRTVEEMARP